MITSENCNELTGIRRGERPRRVFYIEVRFLVKRLSDMDESGVTTGTYTLPGLGDGGYDISVSAVTPGYIGSGYNETLVVIGECGHESSVWRWWDENYVYTSLDDAYHTVEYDEIGVLVCSYCGEELGERNINHYVNDEEVHAYNEEGVSRQRLL